MQSMAFCHVPAHLKATIRSYRQCPPVCGRFVSSWTLPCPPFHVAVSSQNLVFVADWVRDCVYVYTPDGVCVRKWGSCGNGVGQLNGPRGVAVSPSGAEVVVADSDNHRVVVFRTDGTFVRMWGSKGTRAGQFVRPQAVTVTREGEVAVADCSARVQVFHLADGGFVRQWKALGHNTSPGVLCAIPKGQMVMADEIHHCVKVVSLEGVVLRQWGSLGSTPGKFNMPCSVAVCEDGKILVGDCNHRVQVFQPDGKFVCMWGSHGKGHGQFQGPSGLAVTRVGLVLVADYLNNRVQVFQ